MSSKSKSKRARRRLAGVSGDADSMMAEYQRLALVIGDLTVAKERAISNFDAKLKPRIARADYLTRLILKRRVTAPLQDEATAAGLDPLEETPGIESILAPQEAS